MQERGDVVTFDLKDDDIDIILMTDPRWRSPNVSFAAAKILRYVTFRNPKALVVHRINECDERKHTRTMNFRLRTANYCADHTVLVGSWLKNLRILHPALDKALSVILNGGNTDIFHSKGNKPWDHQGPLRLVTHHWGYHWLKGFDVYTKLDAMLGEDKWKNKIAFTYIGNLPKNFEFRNTNYVKPMSGNPLADALRRNHVYLTGSVNEPGGNHQVEGGLCGLPLIYRNSGCMPEYCDGFGVMFDDADIEPALEKMLADYDAYLARMSDFPHTADKTTAAYVRLFDDMLSQREMYVKRRRERKSFWHFLLNQLPY